ncbi:MAG: biotin/lipoate A/B protein ligase family protein [Thermoanaerobaculales bacterium]
MSYSVAVTRWRLLLDSDRPGARNMARDVAMLEAVAAGEAAPALRLYGWDPPCLSLGKHQGLDAADLLFCAREGVDVVRRPTGGRALLHHLELTYAVTAPLGSGPLPRGLQEAYRTICEVLVRACSALGVEAELAGGEVNLRLPGPRTTIPCFEVPAGGEVVVRGRKLIGSAMRAHKGVILQHGAILLDWDGRMQAGAMGLKDGRGLRPHITTLVEQLGRAVAREELGETIEQAFEEALGIELEPDRLTDFELKHENELARSFSVVD